MTIKIDDENNFTIRVSALSGTDSRLGQVVFTVFKENKFQTGAITIVQNALTPEALQKTERCAIKSDLSKFGVINLHHNGYKII